MDPDEVREVLEACLAYLEDREDADYDMNAESGGYVPNEAMRLAGRVREVLALVGREP
jgi:hypothetical protein